MKLETDNGEIVWISCDLIQGYKYVNEYIDNNENKFKIQLAFNVPPPAIVPQTTRDADTNYTLKSKL